MFSSFKQTLLGAGEMVRASFPFWSLKQSVSTCLNCFCPRGLKLKKMSSLSAAVMPFSTPVLTGLGMRRRALGRNGCYAWFTVTWQGGHVGGQYNKQCFEEFIWIWFLVPSGDKQFCLWSPTWPLWRYVQTSNAIGHVRVPRTLTFKMRPSAQPFLWKWVLFAWEW